MGQNKLSAKFNIKNGMQHDALADAYTSVVIFHKLYNSWFRRFFRWLDISI